MNLSKKKKKKGPAKVQWLHYFTGPGCGVKLRMSPKVLCNAVAACVISLTWVFFFCLFVWIPVKRKVLIPKAIKKKTESIFIFIFFSMTLTGSLKGILNILDFNSVAATNSSRGSILCVSRCSCSGGEGRRLHAALQRGLLRGAEGAASLRARPEVGPAFSAWHPGVRTEEMGCNVLGSCGIMVSQMLLGLWFVWLFFSLTFLVPRLKAKGQHDNNPHGQRLQRHDLLQRSEVGRKRRLHLSVPPQRHPGVPLWPGEGPRHHQVRNGHLKKSAQPGSVKGPIWCKIQPSSPV